MINEKIIEEILTGIVFISFIYLAIGRMLFNVFIYNESRGTDYSPLFLQFQEGGFAVSYYCSFVFYWFTKKNDSESTIKYKKIANISYIISLAIIVLGIYILSSYFST